MSLFTIKIIALIGIVFLGFFIFRSRPPGPPEDLC